MQIIIIRFLIVFNFWVDKRKVLGLLDHPFLSTLYSHFKTKKFSYLLMEFCNGGNLQALRPHQSSKHFAKQEAKYEINLFYFLSCQLFVTLAG